MHEQKNQAESVQPASVWQIKPWWCQPWSIILTSIALITASEVLFHRWWITVLVAIPVLTWMIFFVGIYPRLYLQSIAADIPSETPPDEITPSI
jgi:membrane protein YdbS with pleckstrin-like domain